MKLKQGDILLEIVKEGKKKGFNFSYQNGQFIKIQERGRKIMDKFPNVLGEEAEIFFEGKWVRGKICNGYRFQDGIVTIETPEGQKLWCGADRTDLYRKVED